MLSICVCVRSWCRTAKELQCRDLLLDVGVLSMERWRVSSDQISKPTSLLHTRKWLLLLYRNFQCFQLLLLPVINVLPVTNVHASFLLPLLCITLLLFLFLFFFFLFLLLYINPLLSELFFFNFSTSCI